MGGMTIPNLTSLDPGKYHHAKWQYFFTHGNKVAVFELSHLRFGQCESFNGKSRHRTWMCLWQSYTPEN